MIKENLSAIQKEIDAALARRKGKKLTGDAVKLVTVSKTHPAEMVREALAAGVEIFGENKVQEAAAKIPLVNGGKWHLIGHLQTNKVKQAVSLFDIIYSVDSERLLAAIDQAAAKAWKVQDVLLQVNIAGEESKSGFSSDDFSAVIKQAKMFKNICLRGIMVIAPEYSDAELSRPVFKAGYETFCLLLAAGVENAKVDILSMGMSGDFRVAIEEGANNIRLGTAIFGKRDYKPLKERQE